MFALRAFAAIALVCAAVVLPAEAFDLGRMDEFFAEQSRIRHFWGHRPPKWGGDPGWGGRPGWGRGRGGGPGWGGGHGHPGGHRPPHGSGGWHRPRPFPRPRPSHMAIRVRYLVRHAIGRNPRLGATLLRLAFHDAFTFTPGRRIGGANGSIRFELSRPENAGLAPAVQALIPFQRETGLGWGDCVALAGAEAVSAAGGPHIDVRLGRPHANRGDPGNILPDGSSNLAQLRAVFAPRGFTDMELVALSGAHTIGRVQGGRVRPVPFVRHSTSFSNDYFINLKWYIDQREAGLSDAAGPPMKPNHQLDSDLALISDPHTSAIVELFARSERRFFHTFKLAYRKLMDSGF